MTLVKDGPGKMVLSGNSTYTGGTRVDDGTLALGHVNALGGGAVQVNTGGTLDGGGYNIANDIILNGGTYRNNLNASSRACWI